MSAPPPTGTDDVVVSDALRQWIREVTGIAITSQNQAPVELAVRIQAERFELHPYEFVSRLLGGLLPAQAFVDEITTNESYFFRAIDQMQVVVQHLVPDLMQRRPGRPVRLLSIPCARGEEPFSLAILLREHNIPDAAVELVGLDISQTCLDDARAGCYGLLALRRTDPERSARWFRQRQSQRGPHQVVLDPDIRARVHFVRGNLLTDAFRLLRPPFDLVFCENLLIYFDESTANQALSVLNRLLAPDGWLFVDHAEWSLPRERFRMQTLKGCVGFRPANDNAPKALSSPSSGRSGVGLPTRAPTPASVMAPAATPARHSAVARPTSAGSRFGAPSRQRSRPFGTDPSPGSDSDSGSVSGPGASKASSALHRLLTVADAHYRAKRFNDALLGYEQALALAPRDAAAWLGKTRVLADCGEDFEALEQAESLLEGIDHGRVGADSAQQAEALGLIALLLNKKGLTDLAQGYLRKLAALDPSHQMLSLLDGDRNDR